MSQLICKNCGKPIVKHPATSTNNVYYTHIRTSPLATTFCLTKAGDFFKRKYWTHTAKP